MPEKCVIAEEWKRSGNVDGNGVSHPIAETEVNPQFSIFTKLVFQKFAYGTAGFRMVAEKLPFVAYRCGYLAALRAK